MLSLDFEACLLLGIIATLFISNAILTTKPVFWQIVLVAFMLVMFLGFVFEVDSPQIEIALTAFICVTGLMAGLFDGLVRDNVPRWVEKAYVVDVGLVNGVVTWLIIKP